MKILNVGDVVYNYSDSKINRYKVARVTKTQAILTDSLVRLKRSYHDSYLQTVPKQRMWDTWSWSIEDPELKERYEQLQENTTL
jgi:hypothetical protein